ncbi:MAG: hypothetical protein WAW36_18885 [Methylovulum miyakonense]|uniref:hypothetical protein n=1 Tax=Methylovulum miyakonense TaxID=645578 RepID=UPI003BB7E42B
MAVLLDGIGLPDDLVWVDQYTWSPVKQALSIAVDGSLIIESAAQLAGRPMTLAGGQEHAWVTKATVDALQAKLYQPALEMELNWHGDMYNVIFTQPDGVAAQPIVDYADPADTDFYAVTLKFLQL